MSDPVLITAIATLILVIVTAWYTLLTSRILKEMRRQGAIQAFAAAASVQAARAGLPAANEWSKAHQEANTAIKELDDKIWKLLAKLEV